VTERFENARPARIGAVPGGVDHPGGGHDGSGTARAVAVSEGNGRTALYVGALSSTLVALALVAQRSPLGEVFFAVALTVLPAVLFLGLVTFVRVLQSSVEDILAGRAPRLPGAPVRRHGGVGGGGVPHPGAAPDPGP
jgi:hypothetical protein